MNGIEDLLSQLLDIVTNAKSMGVLAIAAGVLALGVQATKLSKVRSWLDTRSYGAWIAVGLGALSSALASLARHQPWIVVLGAGFAGAVAGLTGVGLYEATAGRSPKRQALLHLGSVMSNPPASSRELDGMKRNLEAAKAETDEDKRLIAKAAWLDKWLA